MAKPTEQVRVLKFESAGLGGDAADSYDTPADIDPTEDVVVAAGIAFGKAGADPFTPVDMLACVYRDPVDDKVYLEDVNNSGPNRKSIDDLAAGTGGLTEGAHETLDTLVHSVAENFHEEVVRTSGKVSRVTVWTDATMTKKIRETLITRVNGKVSQVVTAQYDGSGVVVPLQTLTETITRTAGKVTAVDAVES